MSGSIDQGITVAVAPAPVPAVISDAPAEVGYGQSIQIGTITTATGLSPLSIVVVGDAPQGMLSINAQDEVIYTAPSELLPGEVDSFTYEIQDSTGGVSAPVSVSLALDQGPAATDPTLVVSYDRAFDLSGIVSQLATPGLAGDTLTLTSVSAAQGTIIQQANGDFAYEAVENGGASGAGAGKVAPVTGTDTITYTVTDQLGDSVTGTATVDIDPGPTLAAGSIVVGHGQMVDLTSTIEGLITPGLPGDTETITSVAAEYGRAGLATGANGQLQVGYIAPTSGDDTVTYRVRDEAGDIATGTLTVTTDPGPAATDPSFIVGHAGTLDLSAMAANLATPGLAGDTLTVTAVSAASGTIVQNAAGDFVYQPPAASSGTNLLGIAVSAALGNSDTITYTVADQYGDTVTGTAAITIDPGPAVAPGQLVVGHGQTVNLASTIEGLITPGLPGDSERITDVSAQQTKIGVVGGAIEYTASAGGNDTVTFDVSDTHGDSATGSIAVTIDPGPAAIDPALVVGHGGSIDLSTIVNQLATPGLMGDTLTVTAASAASGTLVQSKDGDFIYEPNTDGGSNPSTVGYDLMGQTDGAISASPAATLSSDIITYTVADQLGDTTTGTATVLVDPGPTATDPTLVVGRAGNIDLSQIVGQLATPGLAGDTLTVTAASAGAGTIVQDKAGDFIYQPIAATSTTGTPGTVGYDLSDSTAGGSGKIQSPLQGDTVSYTVQDQAGDTVTGTAAITIDPGPTVPAGQAVVIPGQTANLAGYLESLVVPGFKGDTETITSVSAQTGAVSLGNDVNGALTVDYVAPTAGIDTLTFSVQDQYGDTATGSVAITADPGPILTPGALTIGHGQTDNLTQYINGLITPGMAGDTDTITAVQAETGTAALTQYSLAGESSTSTGKTTESVSYTAPASGNDVLTYTVTDQNGIAATGTVAIGVDPGPQLTAGNVVVGHGQTTNLTSAIAGLIAPGLPGDTDTVTAITALTGTTTLSFGEADGVPDGCYDATYTAPASGDDILTYTVQDQNGDLATGHLNVAVDPGPAAGNVSADVAVGQTIDLTQQVLGADRPGFAGDTLTLVGDNAQGTLGSVSLVNGDLVYTASNAAFASLGAGSSTTDSFAYTVSDQYGDKATGTVTLDVTSPVTTVNGNPNGGVTIEGPGGNAVINAYGWNNQIDANGGNDTINAGQGNATVNAGSGNVTVNLNGYNNVVTGGDGTDTVTGGLGSATVTLGNGNDTINLGGYGNSITVGNGDDTIASGEGNASITGGSGTDVVTLQGYQDSVSFSGGNDTIGGGAGSDTYDLTGGNASLALNGYTDMVFLHSTNATIMDAGQGAVISISGGGNDVIRGAGSDPSLVVDLTGGLGGYGSAASVLASLTSDGNGGAMLSFGASHGSLDFVGVAPSALQAANFHIG